MLLCSSSEKKLVKPLTIAIFGPYLGKKGQGWATPEMTIKMFFHETI